MDLSTKKVVVIDARKTRQFENVAATEGIRRSSPVRNMFWSEPETD